MVSRITVVGAGTMGHGIAHAAIMAGYDTTMYDVAQAALDKGCSEIARIIDKGVELALRTVHQQDQIVQQPINLLGGPRIADQLAMLVQWQELRCVCQRRRSLDDDGSAVG